MLICIYALVPTESKGYTDKNDSEFCSSTAKESKSYSSTDKSTQYAVAHSLRLHPAQEKLIEVNMSNMKITWIVNNNYSSES